MTFLPIVERELKVAARRAGTYRLRLWVAVIAAACSFAALLSVAFTGGRTAPGGPMFTILSGYALLLSLLAGVFLTSDSLSEEKRDGTLGLLFLTDLSGYDVVLGKFAARSLSAFLALIAVLPFMAVPLTLGGVTAGEFWRTALVLVNALFFSLAAGICVSAFLRDSNRAIGNTLGLVFVTAAALPLLARFVMAISGLQRWSVIAWCSPSFPFGTAADSAYLADAGRFWWPLLISHSFAWSLLALAAWGVTRHWQDHPVSAKPPPVIAMKRAPRKPSRGRLKLLEANPVAFLVSGNPTAARIAWILALTCAAAAVALHIATSGEPQGLFFSRLSFIPIFGFPFKALVALQACRFFSQSRLDGSLETLLSTPLTTRQILRGQAMSLSRSFLGPTLIFVGAIYLPVLAQVLFAAQSPIAGQGLGRGVELATAGVLCLRFLADVVAVAFVGTWLSLSMKKPGLALATTILAVLVLPGFLCWLDLLADFVFVAWTWTRLSRLDLRRYYF